MSYSFLLAARVLLYASSHRQDNTYHGLCYTSYGALAGTRNSSMGPPMKDRSDYPSHHERTLLPQSYISLRVLGNRKVQSCGNKEIYVLTPSRGARTINRCFSALDYETTAKLNTAFPRCVSQASWCRIDCGAVTVRTLRVAILYKITFKRITSIDLWETILFTSFISSVYLGYTVSPHVH